MSAASPAWQLYTAQMDAMVLTSLKASILTSLDAMYATIACLDGADTTQVNILLLFAFSHYRKFLDIGSEQHSAERIM